MQPKMLTEVAQYPFAIREHVMIPISDNDKTQ